MNKTSPNPGRDSRGRFVKGASPNPLGRPKKVPEAPASGLEFLFDRTLKVRAPDGSSREATVEEAVQQRTLQDALKGKARPISRVVTWIIRRDKWLRKEAEKNNPEEPKPNLKSFDPENAIDALQILGIATRDRDYDPSSPDVVRLELEPWAVQLAFSKRRNTEPFTKQEILNIEICTRDADSLTWPQGSRKNE